MKLLYISVFIVSLNLSCSQSKLKSITYMLTNNGTKYWYRFNKDSLKHYGVGYCFHLNGTFIRYYNPKSDIRIRSILNNPPIYSKPVWKIVNDSILMLGENEYFKIIVINDNNLVLDSEGDSINNYLKLHKEDDQKITITQETECR